MNRKITAPEKLRLKALKVASRNGLGDLAQDFASYCLVRFYEGRASDLKYMLIDFKRETFGDARRESGARKMQSNLGTAQTDLVVNGLKKELESSNNTDLSFFHALDSINLKGIERACIVLEVFFGFEQKEIALCFGITRGRVSQILSKAKERLRQKGNPETL